MKRAVKRQQCTHCKRKREPRFIEWHAGIDKWQCSDFDDCDDAQTVLLAKVAPPDMDLLEKFATGKGGARTGRLKALGLLTWRVTDKGRAWLRNAKRKTGR